MENEEYDVAVIGGGVTGTGVARDCAMRGLRTILLEKNDFSAGTTGICSGMIHGGIRYLMFDVNTTRISCIDSGYIQKIAPHLLFRIPFIYPVFKGKRYMLEAVETFFSIYDKYISKKRGKPHVRLTKEDLKRLEPRLSDDVIGAVSMDEWGINTFRLCAINALSAHEHGATIRNHAEVIGFIKGEDSSIVGLKTRDCLEGSSDEIRARIVINAAGPWVPSICKTAGVAEVKLRPSKGTHIIFDRRISNVGILVETIDGRSVFFIPHESTTILGCTDDDYYGDIDDIHGNHDEIEYLLQAAEKVFPPIRNARMTRVMAGVRPTLFEWGKYEDDLSREYEIFDHEGRDGVRGFITIAGGKLAVYRMMAKDVADLATKKLGTRSECTTHLEPLPGGEREVSASSLAKEYGLHEYVVNRMVYRHGSRAIEILEDIKANKHLATCICRCEPVSEAEIRYVIRKEWVKTLDDLRRRTRLGMGPCQGTNCTIKAAYILGEELGYPPEKILLFALDFMKERWKGKRLVLKDIQLAQEELNQASNLGVTGLPMFFNQ